MAKSTHNFAVYGALRSGTTLLRIMLNGHSNLACPGETDFLFDYLIQGDQGPSYDLEGLRRDRIYRAHEAQYATPLTTFTPDAFLERFSGSDQIGVLMQHRHLDRLLDVYPNMPIVHLLRDPRDVARSSIGMGWAGSTYFGIDHWIETEDNWHKAATRFADGQVLQIHYESLIREPEKTLRDICDFIGLSYESTMLEYEDGSTYSRPDPNLTEQWKRLQTPESLALLEHKLGDRLERANYAPSGHTPKAPSRAQFLSLLLKNKQAVWRHRIKRFGLRDPLIVAVSRRLKRPSWSIKAQERIDRKALQFLK